MSTASVFLLWFINEFILFYLWDLCIILLTMMDKQWISNWCLCLWLDRQTHHWLDRDHTLIETDKLTKDNWNAEKLFVVSLDRRKTEDSLKLAASKTDLCKKKKKTISISIVRTKEATSLTFPFVIWIVLMKPKIPKMFSLVRSALSPCFHFDIISLSPSPFSCSLSLSLSLLLLPYNNRCTGEGEGACWVRKGEVRVRVRWWCMVNAMCLRKPFTRSQYTCVQTTHWVVVKNKQQKNNNNNILH